MSHVRRWVGGAVFLVFLIFPLTCGSFTDSRTVPSLEEVGADPLGDFIKTLPEVYLPWEPDPDAALVDALAERFRKPRALIQRVIDAANQYAYEDYPTRDDILAIISVESSFNPRASYQGSHGLMQIMVSVHKKALRGKNVYNVEDNISVGVAILRDYYEQLGKVERSAVLAYNAGIGNFLKKRYNVQYHRKYIRELKYIRSITR